MAFGIVSLSEFYRGPDRAELKERQEFLVDNTLAQPPAVGDAGGLGARSACRFDDRSCRTWHEAAGLVGAGPFASVPAGVLLEAGAQRPQARPARRQPRRICAGSWGEAGLLEFEFADDTASDFESYDAVAARSRLALARTPVTEACTCTGEGVRGPRRPRRAGLPALLVHHGHRAGGRVPVVDAWSCGPGMRVLDVGCGPGRHAHALARAGRRGRRRRHLGRLPGRPRARPLGAGRRPAAALCPRQLRRRHLAVPGRIRAARRRRRRGGPGARWPESVKAGGRIALTAFSAYFAVRYLEQGDTFDAATGVNHERAEVRDPDGAVDDLRPVDHLLHAPGAAAAWPRPPGCDVTGLWAVRPGVVRRPARPTSTTRSSCSRPRCRH